jgi:hypothetical protein
MSTKERNTIFVYRAYNMEQRFVNEVCDVIDCHATSYLLLQTRDGC